VIVLVNELLFDVDTAVEVENDAEWSMNEWDTSREPEWTQNRVFWLLLNMQYIIFLDPAPETITTPNPDGLLLWTMLAYDIDIVPEVE